MRISWRLLRDTDWDLTLRVALTRGFFTGVVLIVMGLIWAPPPLWQIPLIPPMWALIAVPLGLFLYAIAMVVSVIPVAGIVASAIVVLGSLAVCLGDPVVYFLNKAFPGLLAVRDIKFINFHPMFFVVKPPA